MYLQKPKQTVPFTVRGGGTLVFDRLPQRNNSESFAMLSRKTISICQTRIQNILSKIVSQAQAWQCNGNNNSSNIMRILNNKPVMEEAFSRVHSSKSTSFSDVHQSTELVLVVGACYTVMSGGTKSNWNIRKWLFPKVSHVKIGLMSR